MKLKSSSSKKTILRVFLITFLFILIFLDILLIFSYYWAARNFGNIGMDQIIFTINMPLKGTESSHFVSYIKTALIPSVLLFLILFYVFTPRFKVQNSRENRFRKKFGFNIFPIQIPISIFIIGIIISFSGLLYKANQTFDLFPYLKNQFQRSSFIEENYVDPNDVDLVFPEKKRNLITIFVESAETSNQDVENGGLFENNYIPEMTEIAKNNVSFSQSDLLEGATVTPASGWTVAGLVSETAGLPLKLYNYNGTTIDNSMNNYKSFLPGVTSIGDILKNEGYTNVFMAGSDMDFGGRKDYFVQHGDYKIWDYPYAIQEGYIPNDYRVWWGFEDEKLYSFAKEELLNLAQNDQPFNFSMLTVDTHHEDGYWTDQYEAEWGDNQYANVWSHASKQLNEFINWIEEQSFFENTTIVIVGDHCSMDADFYGTVTYDKHGGSIERKVYNAFINPALDPVNEKNRQFTTMDIFPSTLAALGVEIPGNRLGLGTNLFSTTPTLSEEYDYNYIFSELNKKSTFYNKYLLYPDNK